MKVLELLRAHTNKIPPDASLQAMVDILDLYQVLLIPVVDEDDLLLGVVYEEQIAKAVLDDVRDTFRSCSELQRVPPGTRDLTARDIMLPAIAADHYDDVKTALATMFDTGLTRLPVTSSGRVIGTLSQVDVCQALLAGDL